MKIAVATNNGVNVTGHLGRCRSFIVYEIENNEIKNRELRENVFTHHRMRGEGDGQHHHHGNGEGHQHHHGEGHGHGHNALIEGLSDCQTVIFNSGGWRVVEDLRANNIQPFLTDETNADTAVKKYIAGDLEERTENTCHHHE